MKLINRIFLLLSVSSAMLACERDYDQPLLTEPEYTGPAANTTIAELREIGAGATEDVEFIIADDLVLKAVITGNDESGNIFKKIYLQDETGAIEMGVDQNSVYNYYPIGQTVYIDLNGMSISVYGDEQQLGHPDGHLYRTPWEEFTVRVSKDGWANPDNAKPIVLDDISTVNADVEAYKFKLVQFTNVSFVNGGKNTFAPEEDYGEETITDSHGNTIMVRTSSYADFAGDILPEGTGNVTGILGRFSGAWQLTLRTADDVSDFTGGNVGGEGEGEQPGTTKTILDESFANGIGNNFTIEDKKAEGLNYVWTHDEAYSCMKASAFTGSPVESESWLVSSPLDLTNASSATLTFEHAINKANGAAPKDYQIVAVSTDNGSTWETLSGISYPAGDSWAFQSSGDVDISAYTGHTVIISFQYNSTTASAATWEVKNVKVTATIGGSSQGGSGGTAIEPVPTNK